MKGDHSILNLIGDQDPREMKFCTSTAISKLKCGPRVRDIPHGGWKREIIHHSPDLAAATGTPCCYTYFPKEGVADLPPCRAGHRKDLMMDLSSTQAGQDADRREEEELLPLFIPSAWLSFQRW